MEIELSSQPNQVDVILETFKGLDSLLSQKGVDQGFENAFKALRSLMCLLSFSDLQSLLGF